MNIRSVFLPVISFITAALGGPVEDAEAFLQGQKYKEAGAVLTDAALAQAPEKGYARYLRALALAESKEFAAAITDCDAVPAEDVWHRKALFLKAQCLAELKRHKEAEEIYSAESTRQFATVRQEKLAGVLVSLARELVKPAAPGQTVPDDARSKALNLYRKAIELESGPALRETLLFETAELLRLAKNEGALKDGCEAYLAEFDPDWKSPGTNAKPKSALVGSHRWAVRAMLIEGSLRTGDGTRAKTMGADVLALWKAKPLPEPSRPDEGDIEWMICRASGPMQIPARAQLQLNTANTYNQQQGVQRREVPRVASDPVRYIEAIRAFLKKYPNHQRSAEAARTLIEALESHGKKDEAIAACKVLYDRADWPAPAPQQGDARTPTERLDAWRQEAFYKEGELEFSMRRYRKATEQWRAYIVRHPDGALWQKAQSAIIDTEFQLCLEAVAASQQEEAAKRFEAFIAAHPLDTRCAQLLFLNGQWHYAAAQAMDKAAAGKPRTKESIASHERAIAEWAKLIAKHPRSDEASLALFTTGVIQADVLGRFEEALATVQRVNWGSSQAPASSRAAAMTQKSLALRTPRVFRSNEPAHVRVDTRNIEKLKVSRYTLNLEDYFRSRHRLDGEGGIGSLDIDLIQPDKTWEVPVADYARLKPVEQEIAVPFDGAKPGVCVVRVEGDDWQSSTIVVRSDIDVIVQSAWTEALIFVQNRVKGAVVADAEVLISNGKEIIGQGRTGADGVFRLRGEMVRAAADLCVYVRTPAGEAIQRLDLRGMTQEITDGETDRESVTPARQGFIYPDKPAYQPGETVHFRGVIRDVEKGAYTIPAGREYEVRVQDEDRRVLRKMKVKLGEFGTFTEGVPLPAGTPLGEYRIAVRSVEGDEAYGADFRVVEFTQNEIAGVFETKPEAVFRGDRIDGVVRLRYAWGLPVADQALVVTMPDGRQLDGKTDASGAYAFTQETGGFQPGQFVTFDVVIKGRDHLFSHTVNIVKAGTSLVLERVPAPALSGEAASIRVKALSHKGQPIATRVKLTVALKPEQKPNAVLSGLPGLGYIPAVTEPVQIEELTLQTDPVTGVAEARPVLKNAAIHIITARSTDARGNVAEVATEMQVSGADDPQKLRMFSDLAEVAEGAALKVDAHSRVAAPLALVTLAGEAILEHRVVELAAGHNDIAMAVGSAHWPQFEVSVLYLDGDKLHCARHGFVVKRPLSIELETPAVPPEPGAEIDIVVTTKDGLGKPVAAELSVALTGSGLFTQCPDEGSAISAAFAENLRTRGSIRTSSSAGSGHRGESRMIVKDGAATPPPRPQSANTFNQQTSGQVMQTIPQNGLQIQANAIDGQIFLQGGGAVGDFEPPQIPQGFGGGSPVSKSTGSPAKAALWWSPVVTDAAGKATIKVRVPSGGDEWRLLARGCTKGSAFGEVSKILVTKAAPENLAKLPPVAASAEYDADLRHAGMLVTKPGTLNLPATERQRTVFAIHDSPLSLLRAMGLGTSDSADGRARTPQTASSQLLAAVSSMRAIKGDGKDEAALAERISLLISALQITQRDGGWTWENVEWKRDSVVTSLGLWALVEARALGFAVEDATVNSAASFLKGALAIIPPDEPEKAAVILHALAMVNQADFSVANRLLRDRAKLNDPALAHLAAAFLRMERPQEAQELLKALEARPEWTGSAGTGRLSRADDTVAIILYAAARAQAGLPLAKKAADVLVEKLGVSCGADSPLRGLIAAALAEHFIGTGLHRIAPAQKLELSVDGKRMEAPFQTGNGNAAQRVDLAFADGKGTPILLATSVVRSVAPAAPVASLPVIVKREWLHEGMRHNDLPLKAASTSPVTTAALGQRIHVKLTLRGPQTNQSSYVTLDEPLPAGCHLRPETVASKAMRMEEIPGRVRLWFTPGTFRPAAEVVISYELIALHPGDFTIPPTIVRDACRPLRQPAGTEGKISILETGKPSPEPYQINRAERLELAKLLFDSRRFEEARAHLDILRSDTAAMRDNEREIARMLLWAHTARAPMESKQVVELFETLSERHPDIVIPFDRILKVGEAYRQIGEFERAWLVYRATLEGGFVRDAGVSAALEANGDFPASVEHKLALWQEYPDVPDVSLAYFSLAQSLQDKSAEPGAVPVRPSALKPTKTQLLERSRDLLRRFVTLRAKDELADDASFSLANVFFDLKDYASVVKTAGTASAANSKSPFANSFLYMTALGHFWQYQFPEALASAAPVAAGTSTDAPNARYITAQIFHAQGRPAEAIKWYEKVKDEFDDAEESIAVLQEKGVKLPPATSIKPGQPVKLELGYRNVKDAALKIYRVDLMKLHERQKDLSEVSAVNLAGITPEAEINVALGDGLDYAWKKRAVELPMKQEGAYLVICRGDSQMTSALVLITTLDMEINEDPELGNVRVQVRDTIRGSYVADADIATYDSTGVSEPQKGRTDPRGAFSASGIQGYATIVVKLGDTRYAYHRSPSPLRKMQIVKTPTPNAAPAQPAQKQMSKGDYLNNVRELNNSNGTGNLMIWEGKMKSEGQGVKAEKAFKK